MPPLISRNLTLFFACLLSTQLAIAEPEQDYKLGAQRYREGDVVGALDPLKKAADAGHAPAQVMYGYLLDISDFDEDAVVYYRKSAEQGNLEGQFSFGNALMNGEGIAKNRAEGEQWIRKAAESGYGEAINQMALLYLAKNDPTQTDEAMKWINQSIASNYVPVIEQTAMAYREGRLGLAIDVKLADELTSKALKLQGVEKRKRRGVKK